MGGESLLAALVRRFCDPRQHSTEIGVSVEDDERCCCVPPAQVRKKLVNRLQEGLCLPELAFGDQDVSLFEANENIRFSLEVKISPVALHGEGAKHSLGEKETYGSTAATCIWC